VLFFAPRANIVATCLLLFAPFFYHTGNPNLFAFITTILVVWRSIKYFATDLAYNFLTPVLCVVCLPVAGLGTKLNPWICCLELFMTPGADFFDRLSLDH